MRSVCEDILDAHGIDRQAQEKERGIQSNHGVMGLRAANLVERAAVLLATGNLHPLDENTHGIRRGDASRNQEDQGLATKGVQVVDDLGREVVNNLTTKEDVEHCHRSIEGEGIHVAVDNVDKQAAVLLERVAALTKRRLLRNLKKRLGDRLDLQAPREDDLGLLDVKRWSDEGLAILVEVRGAGVSIGILEAGIQPLGVDIAGLAVAGPGAVPLIVSGRAERLVIVLSVSDDAWDARAVGLDNVETNRGRRELEIHIAARRSRGGHSAARLVGLARVMRVRSVEAGEVLLERRGMLAVVDRVVYVYVEGMSEDRVVSWFWVKGVVAGMQERVVVRGRKQTRCLYGEETFAVTDAARDLGVKRTDGELGNSALNDTA